MQENSQQEPKTAQQQFKIKGMHCKSCAEKIEESVKKLAGVMEAKVSFPEERALIRFNPGQISLNRIKEVIKETGYEAVVEDENPSNSSSEKMIRIRLGRSLINNNKMQNKKTKTWTIVLIALFLGAALLTKGFGLFGSAPAEAEPAGESDVLRIPLGEITSNAKWYEYESGEGKVKFFVVKAGDGSIKTGFDACDVCFAEKKGFRQEGDYMVCNNCGNRYPIDGLGTENKNPGGCWPGYLPSVVKEGEVVIKKSDLQNDLQRF